MNNRPTPAPTTGARDGAVLTGLVPAVFAAAASMTLSNPAARVVMADLGMDVGRLNWSAALFWMAAAGTVPLWGAAAGRFGTKAMFRTGAIVFVVGALGCGLAQDGVQFVAGRTVLGLGVGALPVLAHIIAADGIAPRGRSVRYGVLGAAVAVGAATGPPIGVWITDTSWLGWRWCFLIVVPIAALAFTVLRAALPARGRPVARAGLPGALLMSAGAVALLLWCAYVGAGFGWLSWQTFVLLGAVTVLETTALLLRASRGAAPRNTLLASVAAVPVGIAMFNGVELVIAFLQNDESAPSPLKAAALGGIPMVLGLLAAFIAVGRVTAWTGRPKPFAVAGTAVLAAAYAVLFAAADEGPGPIVVGGVLVGLGVGTAAQGLLLAVQGNAPRAENGVATSTVVFFRFIGGIVGGAFLFEAFLGNRFRTRFAEISSAITGDEQADLVALGDSLYSDMLAEVALITVGVAVVGAIASAFMKPVTLRGDNASDAVLAAEPEQAA